MAFDLPRARVIAFTPSGRLCRTLGNFLRRHIGRAECRACGRARDHGRRVPPGRHDREAGDGRASDSDSRALALLPLEAGSTAREAREQLNVAGAAVELWREFRQSSSDREGRAVAGYERLGE